jgi:hypothetical protein
MFHLHIVVQSAPVVFCLFRSAVFAFFHVSSVLPADSFLSFEFSTGHAAKRAYRAMPREACPGFASMLIGFQKFYPSPCLEAETRRLEVSVCKTSSKPFCLPTCM